MKLKQFATRTQHIADSLNEDNWDQLEGAYDPDKPCCIGAHLANFFGVAVPESNDLDCQENFLARRTDYLRGKHAACEYIGCNGAQLCLMLHAAGGPWNSFNPEDWHNPVGVVWRNLAQIETLPPEATEDDPNRTARWIAQHHIRFGIRST